MNKQNFLGAILLISGTCIGAGMLALPIATAPIGFRLSCILLIMVWFFMCFTGLLIVEVNAWLPSNTSYISMANSTLGKPGKIITWLTFLLLLYSLLAAYITGGGDLFSIGYTFYFQYHLKPWQSYIPWIIIFTLIIYRGIQFSDIINRILMLGLIVSFATLATIVTPRININLLFHSGSSKFILSTLPIIFASYGYHIVLPSIRDYLNNHSKKLKWAVILGSFIPLCFYIFWEFLIFGLIPSNALLNILREGGSTNILTQTISVLTHHVWIGRIARFFVFFAIASSFVGVSIGLFDLLADGLKIKKTFLGRGILALLTLIPPLIFALAYPKGFILALGYAGIFVAILHGILPAIMAWSGRYYLKLSNRKVFLGKLSLIFVILIALVVIYAQLGVNFHWIPNISH